tara:strand:+ start:1459 stop:2076 length:618 start_codon:yes stop_codon:yes gene_type:complete
MGLKNWLKKVIPDEWSVTDIMAGASAAYLGYKGVTGGYSAAKSFTSPTGFLSTTTSAPGAPGMTQYTSGFDRLKGFVQSKGDTELGKFVKGFGQQVAGKALEGESEADAKKRFAEEQARINQMMKTKQYNIPSGVPLQTVGAFKSTRAQVPGFKNPHVNESLNMMAYFMQDLNDNGRIDSSALYAEAPRGVTIGLPSAKSMKMSI